jgi:hypothetical protein
MVAQAALPFKYEASTTSGATAFAGLPLYLELSRVVGLRELIEKHLPPRGDGQGWQDADVVTTLVLLNLAGGEHVSDLELLRRDEGFVRVLREVACAGLPRKERRAKMRLMAKSGEVPLPSASAVFRFLQSFHGAEQEVERKPSEAVIVPEHARLRGLWQVAAGLLAVMQQHRPLTEATLDGDATLIETHKATALHCYKGYRAYQPLNFYLAEWDMVAYSQFRDGNVPCGFRQLEALERALELLPAGIVKVRLRMDTQGYEWELLRYLAEARNPRFGVIEFAVGADVTPELKREVGKLREEDWQELPRQPGQAAQQWAEPCYVPNASATKKDGPQYRFLVTREVLAQQPLPGVQLDLPFPTMQFDTLGTCKLHAVVTNRKLDGAELIAWYRKRCGKSEEAHAVMKTDLAGGTLPSGDFGNNAAWWTIMLLAFNLNALMKRLALGTDWVGSRIKAIRRHVICVAARVVDHARQVVVRLSGGHPSTMLLQEVRARILALAPGPGE